MVLWLRSRSLAGDTLFEAASTRVGLKDVCWNFLIVAEGQGVNGEAGVLGNSATLTSFAACPTSLRTF